MTINFTRKEYQALVEMLLVADWVINAEEAEETEAREPYRALRKKVLSHVKAMGMGQDFQYDPGQDEYFETAEYEARAPHLRFVDEHDEATFWSKLADKLAARDVAAELGGRGEGAISEEQWLARLFEITERYENELEEHGLANLRLVRDEAAPH
jgi:hypothetical protein